MSVVHSHNSKPIGSVSQLVVANNTIVLLVVENGILGETK